MASVSRLMRVVSSPVWPYKYVCQLTANTRAELLAFARELGLREEWLKTNESGSPFFRITYSMRRKAISMGARERSVHDDLIEQMARNFASHTRYNWLARDVQYRESAGEIPSMTIEAVGVPRSRDIPSPWMTDMEVGTLTTQSP